VIDEARDWQQLRQLDDAAGVIGVEVRGDERVDPRDAGALRGRQNALGVAGGTGIAGRRLECAAPG
jgi:hypothetical protein